jgi:bifunctional non-homologous end joining protein LigD
VPARPRGRREDPVAEYRAERDPARTAEAVPPAGPVLPAGNDDTFVVQEHHTPRGAGERVHWDLRLERNGVLRSWAVPTGPPTDPGVDRLAVPTEDRPLAYASFAGNLTGGEHGGGHVSIWDAGRYATETWIADQIAVTFDGTRLRGRYLLARLADGTWNVRKRDAEGPAAAAEVPLPMLATAGALPSPEDDAAWGYEFKWDGVRAVAAVHGGVASLSSRKGTDITVRYPEVVRSPAGLAGHDVVVDGEIVAMDASGRPDFGALQNRMHRTGPEVPRMAAEKPVTFLVFDLLSCDGENLSGLPYAERRTRLDALGLTGQRWVTTPWFRGTGDGVGARVHAASQENGLEGIVAKRLASTYRPGLRSPDWRKIKNIRTQSVVVGGWRPGQGRRAGGIGSLLVGVPDDEGRLVYVGHVGTGFSDQDLRDLERMFTARATAPFDDVLPREATRDAHWIEPDLVGEVAYAVWTAEGRLRHPVWRGVRDDLEPDDVVVEP